MSDSAYVFNQDLSLNRPKPPVQDAARPVDQQLEADSEKLQNPTQDEPLEPFMGELPNLSFVEGLAATDPEFEPTFIAILKKEFTVDSAAYFRHMEFGEPRAAAELVHKLKYALGYLSMNKAFNFAELYEEKLHLGDIDSHTRFKKILNMVSKFLNSY